MRNRQPESRAIFATFQSLLERSVARACCAILGAAFLLPMIGCVGFSNTEVQPVESFPQTQEPKKSVKLNLNFRSQVNEAASEDPDSLFQSNLETRAMDSFTSSGLFSAVSHDLATPDLDVKIDVVDNATHSPALKLITGATAFIIPNRSKDNVVMTAVVSDPAGKPVGNYRMENTVTQWQSLFLAPLMPFKSTTKTAQRAYDDMFQNLALRIHQDGLAP